MKLLVVDDEPVILHGIMRIIERGNTPFTEVVGAADGIDALQLLERFRPDLMITDLHMPELNGLELIHEVQSRRYCDRFIILTGYDDFEYARQAIRYRVIDYLLKPIHKEELLNLLVRTAQSIEKERAAAGKLDLLKLKEHILYNSPFDEQFVSPDELKAMLPYPHIGLLAGCAEPESLPAFLACVNRLAAELEAGFGLNGKAVVLHSRQLGQAVVLINSASAISEAQLSGIRGKLLASGDPRLHKLGIGFSQREHAAGKLRELYNEAIAAAIVSRYAQGEIMAVFDQHELGIEEGLNRLHRLVEERLQRWESPEQIRQDIARWWAEGAPDAGSGAGGGVAGGAGASRVAGDTGAAVGAGSGDARVAGSAWSNGGAGDAADVGDVDSNGIAGDTRAVEAAGASFRRDHRPLLVCIAVYLHHIGSSLEKIAGPQAAAELFQNSERLEGDALAALWSQVLQAVHRTDAKHSTQHTMDKIIGYVEANYKQDLSLDLLSEHVQVHPNYISILFKKEKGTTFLHYLHSFRIHKAKELMSQFPDWPLDAIAEQVGYANPRHFYKVFKKYEHQTPGQFRIASKRD
ncbi:hypothetical protein SD70_02955 [Gordoniibacillus kamchatkensis]|uniref:Response regulator n=1 Tax=Gordoniibacillus kamchatkensis TaxID=1590651 RepID=A0ABR5AM99_9BACL|nr:response regulator [Paenibacillus sp. VKM B-2647]KIL42146.1 hypothetical protein SD70_02955 [Paenibacillus sp. VKM B-2647]